MQRMCMRVCLSLTTITGACLCAYLNFPKYCLFPYINTVRRIAHQDVHEMFVNEHGIQHASACYALLH